MRTEIAEVLIDIEAQLRQLGLWDKIPPSTEALASTQPFCVDTLTLPQWLQKAAGAGCAFGRIYRP